MSSLKSTLKSSSFKSLQNDRLKDAWIKRVNLLKRDLEDSSSAESKPKKHKVEEKNSKVQERVQKLSKKEGRIAREISDSLQILISRLAEQGSCKRIKDFDTFVDTLIESLDRWAERNAQMLSKDKGEEDLQVYELYSKRLARVVVQQHAGNLWNSYVESLNKLL
jgi:hypothetical protein